MNQLTNFNQNLANFQVVSNRYFQLESNFNFRFNPTWFFKKNFQPANKNQFGKRTNQLTNLQINQLNLSCATINWKHSQEGH